MGFTDYLKKLPLRLSLLTLLFVTALLLFALIVDQVLLENRAGFDITITRAFDMVNSGGRLTPFMKVVTVLGSSPFQITSYIVLVMWYIVKGFKTRALDIVTIGTSGYLVTFLLKQLFHRARPSDPLVTALTSFSFPSGHASSGFILSGLLVYLTWKGAMKPVVKFLISTLLILLSVLVGCSRIILKVHYPSDVLAGFCVGFAWLVMALWILEHVRERPGIQ